MSVIETPFGFLEVEKEWTKMVHLRKNSCKYVFNSFISQNAR